MRPTWVTWWDPVSRWLSEWARGVASSGEGSLSWQVWVLELSHWEGPPTQMSSFVSSHVFVCYICKMFGSGEDYKYFFKCFKVYCNTQLISFISLSLGFLLGNRHQSEGRYTAYSVKEEGTICWTGKAPYDSWLLCISEPSRSGVITSKVKFCFILLCNFRPILFDLHLRAREAA